MYVSDKIAASLASLPKYTKVDGRFVGPWKDTVTHGISLLLNWWSHKSSHAHEYEPFKFLKDTMVDVSKPNFELIQSTDRPHLTWVSHASCYYQSDGLYYLTDPVFSKRCSPIQWAGPARFFEPSISIDQLKIDVILLSHTHYDHLDYDSAMKIGNKALWVVPLGVQSILSAWGITNCVELDWWQSYEYNKHHITFVPTRHWTNRTPFDRNTCLWGGYAVKSPSCNFFFGGDTAYCDVFKKVGELLGPFDISAIPVGAYKPRIVMIDNHCDPAEALQIHKDIGSKQSIAIHWGTYPLTDELGVEAALELGRCREIANVSEKEFFACNPGDSFIVGESEGRDFAASNPELMQKYLVAYSTMLQLAENKK